MQLSDDEREALTELRHSYPNDTYHESLHRSEGGFLNVIYRRHDARDDSDRDTFHIGAGPFACGGLGR